MTGTQLSLFGLSVDQNTFQSTLWGQLTFVPTGSEKWSDNCRHCLLWKPSEQQRDDDECLSACCGKDERTDGRCGYFSIQQIPQKDYDKPRN